MSFVHHVVVFAVKAQGKSSKRQKKENRKVSGAKCRICEEVKAAVDTSAVVGSQRWRCRGLCAVDTLGAEVES